MLILHISYVSRLEYFKNIDFQTIINITNLKETEVLDEYIYTHTLKINGHEIELKLLFL